MRIQKVQFGDIVLDNKEYRHSDMLILHDHTESVEKSHDPEIKHFERMLLLEPDMIIVGTGFSGYVIISDKIRDMVKKHGIEFVPLKTPEALKKCQELINKGKKVCAYIHITC